MLDYYSGKHFVINGKVKMIPCPAGNTESLITKYLDIKRNGCTQKVESVLILSYNEYSLRAIHHGSATWVDGPNERQKSYRETKLKKYLRESRTFEFVENIFGK